MLYYANNYDFYALLAKGANNQELKEFDYFATIDNALLENQENDITTLDYDFLEYLAFNLDSKE